MLSPLFKTYAFTQVPLCSTHFCTPPLACEYGVATFPFTAGVTSVPSPSSHTYKVLASANHIPKGNVVTSAAVKGGNPGRAVRDTVASSAAVPVGNVPVVPA